MKPRHINLCLVALVMFSIQCQNNEATTPYGTYLDQPLQGIIGDKQWFYEKGFASTTHFGISGGLEHNMTLIDTALDTCFIFPLNNEVGIYFTIPGNGEDILKVGEYRFTDIPWHKNNYFRFRFLDSTGRNVSNTVDEGWCQILVVDTINKIIQGRLDVSLRNNWSYSHSVNGNFKLNYCQF